MDQRNSTMATEARPAAHLLKALAVLGYLEGAPPHVRQDSQDIDRQLCRALVCPSCRTRGMAYRPLHRGRQYVALAVCSRCGGGQEI